MIPTRRLVTLAALPLVVSVVAVWLPGLVWPMLVLDGLIVLVASVDLLLSRGAVEVQRKHGEVQAVGRWFDVGLEVVNTGRRALRLRVVDAVPGQSTGLPGRLRLPVGSEGTVAYRLRVDRRGEHGLGPVVVRWRSPLALWERQRCLEHHTVLRVYPNFSQLGGHGLRAREDERMVPLRTRRRPGGENEFERLRPYVPGDPYRHIDWKATARRREFVTREYGQESNQNIIFLLDSGRMMSARTGSLTAFDHALNAALMMGQEALRAGDRVGLLVFDQQVRAWLPPRSGARSGARLIRATYDLFPTLDEPDYAAAFGWLSQKVRRRSLVVLLTSVVDEVNAELSTALIGAMATRHLPLCVWIRDLDLEEILEQPASGREAVYERCAAAELVGWRERSLKALQRRGALVVDCRPQELTSTLLARYLDIKARRLL